MLFDEWQTPVSFQNSHPPNVWWMIRINYCLQSLTRLKAMKYGYKSLFDAFHEILMPILLYISLFKTYTWSVVISLFIAWILNTFKLIDANIQPRLSNRNICLYHNNWQKRKMTDLFSVFCFPLSHQFPKERRKKTHILKSKSHGATDNDYECAKKLYDDGILYHNFAFWINQKYNLHAYN